MKKQKIEPSTSHSRDNHVGPYAFTTAASIPTAVYNTSHRHQHTWIWCLSLLMRSGSVRPLALGSKNTMALRQANSVSSIWISLNGSTSSDMTLMPMLWTTASWKKSNRKPYSARRSEWHEPDNSCFCHCTWNLSGIQLCYANLVHRF